MVNTAGGPCVGLKKRPRQHQGDQEPAQLCAAVSSHRWYGGPTCKNCYERNKTERNNQPKMAKTDDAPAESGGDIPLVCLRVSAARCALPPVKGLSGNVPRFGPVFAKTRHKTCSSLH